KEDFKQKYPVLVTALKEKDSSTKSARMVDGSLGYIHFSSNDVSKQPQYVYILGSAASDPNGFNVLPSNFERSVVALSSRLVISPTWLNDRDQFKVPNTTKQGYDGYVNDCLVYSIFDLQSYQASYRNFKDYTNCNRPGRWVNQWFWMDIETVRRYADELNVRF